MNLRLFPSEFPRHKVRSIGGLLCTLLLVHVQCAANTGTVTPSPSPSPIQQAAAASAPATGQETAPAIPPDQLDSLVAPIALFQDPLLSQVLVASTYPLEIVQLQQWLVKNPGLKDQALVDAVQKQPWDASIQAMAALPDVVKRLNDDIQWTTDLGNAFLAQQTGVMDAVQRMRKKAQDKGALKSNEQLKVETKVVESKQVIVVEQSNPQVVYVPSYDPVVVYGAPAYPYPPIYYPPYVPGAALLGFGVGLAMGAAWGGGWGWGAGWGGGDVNVNVNNNFNRNTNVQGGNRTNVSGGNRGQAGGGKWQHNPSHRGGAPYGDRGTANKFGGSARGDSLSNRQAGARNQIGNQGGNLRSNSGAGDRAGVSDRQSGGVGDRGGAGSSNRAGVSDRSSGGVGDRGGAGSSNRAGVSDRSSGGGDRVGSRDVSSRSSGSDRSGFGGGSDRGGGGGGGFSGGSARSSSSRGSSSMGGGGGMSRGGGGGGGMSRGGGGGGGRR